MDKIPEALDACQSGLQYDAGNSALKLLLPKIQKRGEHLAQLETKRRERAERTRLEQLTLKNALKTRKIPTRTTDRPPEMPEAAIALADPLNISSTLSFPVMLLYPVHAQTDFIKQFQESDSLNQHLAYILPVPWDEEDEYNLENVDCYIETIEGGLIKAGKKLSMIKLLSSGKVEVVDGLVKVQVLPRNKAAQWMEDFETRRGKQ